MSEAITYYGVTYDEKTDWRELIAHPSYEGFEKDLSLHDQLGALSEALRGTPMEIGLADAAMEVIERGHDSEMNIVSAAGWRKAPNGFERMLAIVRRIPRTASELWIDRLYGAMFGLRPTDPRLLASFAVDARGPSGTELLSCPARYNPDWLAEHLPSLRPALNAELWWWVAIAGVPAIGDTKLDIDSDASRARLLTAIAKLGEPYVDLLIKQFASLPPDSAAHNALLPVLRAHADFASRIDSAAAGAT